jgi:short-subunit dehydrogenase
MTTRVIAGRTALVTGAGRGIGRATASALAREGVRVVLADLDGDLAEEAARHLEGAVGRTLDVRDAEAFRALVEELDPIDVLVNNAGIMSLGSFLEQDPVLDERQLDVNVRGVIHGMRAVLPGMLRRRWGHVVNVASVAGKAGIPNAAVYSGTKHAVVGLTEAVRYELRDSGVLCSLVLPSIVATELTAGTKPLRYPPIVRPEQVADAVVDVLRTGRADAYVPEFSRLSAILPALLPRSVLERIGRWFGIDQAFAAPDDAARRAYRERILR